MTFAESWDIAQFIKKKCSIKTKVLLLLITLFVGLSLAFGWSLLPFRNFIQFTCLDLLHDWLLTYSVVLFVFICSVIFFWFVFLTWSLLLVYASIFYCDYPIFLAPMFSKQPDACIYTSCQEDDFLLVYEVTGYVKLDNMFSDFYMSTSPVMYNWFWYLLHFMCSRFRML